MKWRFDGATFLVATLAGLTMIYQFITATRHRGRKSNGASLIIGHGCGHHEFLHLHPIQLRLPHYLSRVMVFLDGGNSKLFQTFHPEDWGKDSQFDEHIFFKWVGWNHQLNQNASHRIHGIWYISLHLLTIHVGNQPILDWNCIHQPAGSRPLREYATTRFVWCPNKNAQN